MNKIKADILENSKKDLNKVMDFKYIHLKISMKVNGVEVNSKVKGHTYGRKKNIFMKDFGNKIRCMAKEKCLGLMEQFLKEFGLMIKKKINLNPIKSYKMIKTKFFVI